MRRARSRFGMVGVVSLTAVLAIGACDEDTNSATDQVCDARTSLRDSVETVTSDISDGNFDEARDALPDVTDSYDELVSALDDLSDEQRSDIEPTVDSLRETVEALPEAESLEDLGSDLESMTSDVQSIYDSITQSLDCS